MCYQLAQVFGEGVIVVACCWLAGSAETSAIIGYYTMTGVQEHRKLFLPGGSTEWVSVDKDHRVSRAMIFVIKIDVTGVFFSDSNVWH
jgi:hypothetical protein